VILNDTLIANIEDLTTSVWLCNANSALETDMVRLMGIQIEADRHHVRMYVPVAYGQTLLDNLTITDKMSFLSANVYSYESYQVKGRYISHRECTAEEVAYQIAYADSFTNALATQGFPKSMLFHVYNQQPCITMYMATEEAYEQTPKKGTGKKLII
jgi:hypothetical protein